MGAVSVQTNDAKRWLATKNKDEDDESSSGLNITSLTDIIAEEHKLSKAESKRIIFSIFDSITEACIKKEKASFAKFGSFQTVTRAARKGRNPYSGEEMDIPAKEAIRFKAYTHFKEAVNKK